ncbi:aspartyl protease family protein At5g10770-like [Nymphaea colorata]|nr:aspartyl protease family protein At5g10770-like [Nymphaea colorata]
MASSALFFTIFSVLFICQTSCNCTPSVERHSIQLSQLVGYDDAPASTPVQPISWTGRRGKGEDAILLELRRLWQWDQRRHKRRLKSDIARVAFLQSLVSKHEQHAGKSIDTADGARVPLTSGRKLDTLNYVTRIGIGSQQMSVLVDTGSDLTWVQCSPCTYCYQQQDSLYNSSLSSSYIPIACNSSACGSFEMSAGCASASTCAYDVGYGDGSYTRGDLVRDTLMIGTDTIGGFLFGCGHNNRGLFGGAAGLLGLGRSPPSLISQTFAKYNGVFSYCLPSAHETSGSLILGNSSFTFAYNTTPFVYTSMFQHPQVPTFYLLHLIGITVGGVYINASSPSPADVSSSGRTLIDSGTVITRLGPSLYKSVKDEFVKQAAEFPSAPSFSILDTCFNLSGFTEVSIPTLQFHFSNGGGIVGSDVQVNVDASGIMYVVKKDASQVCMALASLRREDEFAIMGNYQQQNLRIIYDVKESKVGFAPEVCR